MPVISSVPAQVAFRSRAISDMAGTDYAPDGLSFMDANSFRAMGHNDPDDSAYNVLAMLLANSGRINTDSIAAVYVGMDHFRFATASARLEMERVYMLNEVASLRNFIEQFNYLTLANYIAHLDMKFGSDEERDTFFENIKNLNGPASDMFKDYEPIEAFNLYMSQNNIKAYAFHNPHTSSTILFSSKLSFRMYHFILTCIPILMPEWFKEKPLSDWEKEMLKSLIVDADGTAFNKKIDEYLAVGKFLIKKLKAKIGNLVNQVSEDLQKQAENNLARYLRDIENYEKEITRIQKDIEREQATLLGIAMNGVPDRSSEVVDYVLSLKDAKLIHIGSTAVTLEVKTPLTNYDKDLFEKMFNHQGSILHNPQYYRGDLITQLYEIDEIQRLKVGRAILKALFIDEEIKVYEKSVIHLDFRNCTVHTAWDRATEFSNNAVWNPHLRYYDCFGNNMRYIVDALRNKDFIMAFSYAISTGGNLNMAESMNVANFLRDMTSAYSGKCFILPDGSEVDLKQVIQYMKEKGAIDE